MTKKTPPKTSHNPRLCRGIEQGPLLWTYQDIAAIAKVHERTVARWCARLKLDLFRPTPGTVRLKRDQVMLLFGLK